MELLVSTMDGGTGIVEYDHDKRACVEYDQNKRDCVEYDKKELVIKTGIYSLTNVLA